MSNKEIVGDIAERLNSFMLAAGLKQKDLVETLNLSSASVSMMCTGKTKPSVSTITLLCRQYNVNESWLRTGEGEMFRPLDTTEQVAKLLRDVIRTDGSESWQESRRTIIESLAGMPPEFWEQAGAFIKDLADRQKKTE